jgi:hypothetical protein
VLLLAALGRRGASMRPARSTNIYEETTFVSINDSSRDHKNDEISHGSSSHDDVCSRF